MTLPPESAAARRPLVAVVQEDCTGCNTCVDYCLVDCIDSAPPRPASQPQRHVSIRADECIGCSVCAKICDALDVHAIRLVPTPASS